MIMIRNPTDAQISHLLENSEYDAVLIMKTPDITVGWPITDHHGMSIESMARLCRAATYTIEKIRRQ